MLSTYWSSAYRTLLVTNVLFTSFVCIICHLHSVFNLIRIVHFLYSYMCLKVNGTTGEGNNMTVDERKQVAEAWVAEGRNK